MDDITFYGSFEEMMEDMSRAMKKADARVMPTQASIKPGQHFINFRHGPDLPIFGQILDVKALGADEEEQRYIDETYSQPHMKYYRPSKAYSVAYEFGEVGDIHLSEISAIIDPELFEHYREQNWKPPTRRERLQRKVNSLLEELKPLYQHPDIDVYPAVYDPERDTLHLDVIPRSGPKWAETAYGFAHHEGMKYDRDSRIYGIDGQPRVSYSGQVWVRYVGDFLDGSKVALHVWSREPSHEEAEEQLGRLYTLFKERDGLEPIEVFQKYL